jgi:hypothetical protein
MWYQITQSCGKNCVQTPHTITLKRTEMSGHNCGDKNKIIILIELLIWEVNRRKCAS